MRRWDNFYLLNQRIKYSFIKLFQGFLPAFYHSNNFIYPSLQTILQDTVLINLCPFISKFLQFNRDPFVFLPVNLIIYSVISLFLYLLALLCFSACTLSNISLDIIGGWFPSIIYFSACPQQFRLCMNITSTYHNLQSYLTFIFNLLTFHAKWLDPPLPQFHSSVLNCPINYALLKINSVSYFSRYSPFSRSRTNSRWDGICFFSRLQKNNCIKFEAINIKYSTASTAFPPCTKQCTRPRIDSFISQFV